MSVLILPLDHIGQVSDGYHTFDELYEHRILLMLALMASHPRQSWMSKRHDDGTLLEGWFLVGLELIATSPITYHVPERYWEMAAALGICMYETAPPFDGHTSAEVLQRLREWILLQQVEAPSSSRQTEICCGTAVSIHSANLGRVEQMPWILGPTIWRSM